MADKVKTNEELEAERLRQEEVDKLRKKDQDQQDDANAARADVGEASKEPGLEAGGMHPGARPARFARPPGMTPETFPNEPGQGYRPNPANQKTELPPERQAPVPPAGKIGQGRVKPHEQPAEPKPGED